MEQHTTTLESAAIGVQMAASMRNGVDEIKNVMGQLDANEIEDITDDMNDVAIESYDITEALARPVSNVYTPVDVDDQIQNQLDQWDQTGTQTKPIRVSKQVAELEEEEIVLPSVPTNLKQPTSVQN